MSTVTSLWEVITLTLLVEMLDIKETILALIKVILHRLRASQLWTIKCDTFGKCVRRYSIMHHETVKGSADNSDSDDISKVFHE